MADMGPLREGASVAVIGAGPAGAGCALALSRIAKSRAQGVKIYLIEGKRFHRGHHNLCAGVFSPPIQELVTNRLGIPFPEHLVQGYVPGYVLHTEREQIRLPDHGGGSVTMPRAGFDAYMLETAAGQGIEVLAARAVGVGFHEDHVSVYTEGPTVHVDVVVGAFGLDQGAATVFEEQTPYRRPQAMASVLVRLNASPQEMDDFGTWVHAFLCSHRRIEFGAITPKIDHVNVNIAGGDVDADCLRAFLEWPIVRAVLPPSASFERPPMYRGHFPCSLAPGFYGDRYVMVGDAAGLMRAFKGKGTTSGMLTGIRAAETMFAEGISAAAFRSHYVRANADIIDDLPYGRVTRVLVNASMRSHLLDPIVRAAQSDERVRQSLYGAVSAHAPYRNVLTGMFHPHSIATVLRNLAPAARG